MRVAVQRRWEERRRRAGVGRRVARLVVCAVAVGEFIMLLRDVF